MPEPLTPPPALEFYLTYLQTEYLGARQSMGGPECDWHFCDCYPQSPAFGTTFTIPADSGPGMLLAALISHRQLHLK